MTESKATLSFQTHFHSVELSGMELPVEVRKRDMRLVARTLTTKPLDVEPGEYFVTCRLPAGQEMQTYVKIGAGETQVVPLEPDDSDESPAENREVQHFLRRSVRGGETRAGLGLRVLSYSGAESWESQKASFEALSPGNQPTASPTVARLRWFAGNPLETTWIISAGDEMSGPLYPEVIAIPAEALSGQEPVICQVWQTGQPAVNARIPIPRDGMPPEITLLVPEPATPTYRVGIRLPHPTADLLTRYLRRGMFSEANEAIASESMKAEQLLAAKGSDTIAAAVGAYTLLRTGELSRLHEWTQNLMDWFEWLPDGAAIRGEHLARRGEHLPACRAFLLLKTRGLPLFTEGLSYALERLRLYTGASTSPKGLTPKERALAEWLLARLRAFVPYLDFDRTYVTYTGRDPASPDAGKDLELGKTFSVQADQPTPASSSRLEGLPMSNANESADSKFFFNGINAATGEYLEPPKTARQIAAMALSDPAFPVNMRGPDPNARHLRELTYRVNMGAIESFGTRFGVKPDSVKEAGWAVVFARGADPKIIQALRPLCKLREEQAGRFYKEFKDAGGYIPGESKDDFLKRHCMGPGPADPEKVPYYILLVGDPETIPFQFQYQLDVQYAVGRIWFDTVDEYARYAQSVVLGETGKLPLARKAVFFGPQNDRDGATSLSAQQLVAPLARRAQDRGQAGQWSVETILAADATRRRLSEVLGGEQTPALLFTASHGMGFLLGDSRQAGYQGALLCQDWPGPGTGPVDRGHYFAAEDISDSARLIGLISFHFACYGAGTPRFDDFAHQAFRQPTAIAPRSFIAALPRRLLGHPAGGALAVIGHVERAWGCSIVWPDAGRQIQAFEDALEVLMQGLPVGFALESLNQRYADLSSSLAADLLQIRDGTKVADDYALATQWTANNDARSYVILGDPAARLPLAPAGAPGVARAALAPLEIPKPPMEHQPSKPPDLGTSAVPSPVSEANASPPDSARRVDSTGVTVTLPLQLTVTLSVGIQAGAQPAAPSPGGVRPASDAFAVEIDPDYANREGYDASFLGGGSRRVSLPQLSAKQIADAATVNGVADEDGFELKYHHYSVVLNAKRRFAFFTAVNIDGRQAGRPDREPDRWSYDPRIPRSMQVGEDLYADNDLDRGHLVRRLDPAWGRTAAVIKRANDDTFHFTNCSPQHKRFNQGKNLWAGLEDYLLDKATDEERRMTIFTGPVFTATDPVYRGIPIPKRYWKVAVVARPNGQLASLGFIVDQEKLLHSVVSFGPEDVAKTFQVPVSRIEEITGLSFGRLAQVDAGSVTNFAVGESPERELSSFDEITLPRSFPMATSAAFDVSATTLLPPETVEGTDLRYYLVAFDEAGCERMDHPAGQISRLVTQAVADTSVTDVFLFSHGWQGDVPGARRQYTAWLRAIASSPADRQRIRQVRPGFKPVLVGIHWPSQPWGDEQLGPMAFSATGPSTETRFLGEPSLAAALEAYTNHLGDTPEARERVRAPLRKVLELSTVTPDDQQQELPAELADAYRRLDAAIGLGAQGVGGSPSADREPFDPVAVSRAYREDLAVPGASGVVAFGTESFRDGLLAPLRTLSYWKMKDRARAIGENAVHELLVGLQQTVVGRNVRFHLVGHSFGCIVVSSAVAGNPGSAALPQQVDSLILLQGALSLWSYCSDIPYAQGTAGYFHRILTEPRVRGRIVTTRSTFDTAVGIWYPLASRASRSVAFDAPGSLPKYGGIGSYGIQGPGANIAELKMLDIGGQYEFSGPGSVANVEASNFVKEHSDISKPEVAHLVWCAVTGQV